MESRRRFGGNKKGLVDFRNQKVKPHRLITNLVVVLVVVCRPLLPQMRPASPIEDWGTAIPIEGRDRAIPERPHLCGVTSREDRSTRGTVGAGVD
ncbi:hypothetical protein F2Q69_00006494 [Brassica cretica]|uniref:Uncharacterized protein n=1 Tax=Brassica cretica TaxID=69181 RepID=A0A8S9NZK4_BRACR|nr:hypothetical protein F2Q69_00006494 [Brassica cretica]